MVLSSKKTLYGIGILLSLILIWGISFQLKYLNFPSLTLRFAYSRLITWAGLLFIVLYSIYIEKGRFLIWDEKNYGMGKSIRYFFSLYGIILVCGYLSFSVSQLLGIKESNFIVGKLMGILKGNYPLIFFTVITAGITEELIFRGYFLPRLAEIFKSEGIGFLLSSLLFSFSHFGYNSLKELLFTFLMGFVASYFYYKYRNIKILILLHIFIDTVTILFYTLIRK